MRRPLMVETSRLVLRPLRMSDRDDLLAYHSSDAVVRYIPWEKRDHKSVCQAISVYQQMSTSLTTQDDSIVLGWGLKPHDQVIGQSNMTLISEALGIADLGWVTNPSFWRQGYALEASAALLSFAFRELGLQRVISNIDQRNSASARLAEQLGMRLEGDFKKALFCKGEWCDMWLYAVCHSEFLTRQIDQSNHLPR